VRESSVLLKNWRGKERKKERKKERNLPLGQHRGGDMDIVDIDRDIHFGRTRGYLRSHDTISYGMKKMICFDVVYNFSRRSFHSFYT